MIQFVFGFINMILGFLNSLLPLSPFQSLLQTNEMVTVGIGWLNWFFPVGQCLAIFGVWLGLLVAWTAVDMALDAAAAARNSAFGSAYTG